LTNDERIKGLHDVEVIAPTEANIEAFLNVGSDVAE
jgi:hypothetical protein